MPVVLNPADQQNSKNSLQMVQKEFNVSSSKKLPTENIILTSNVLGEGSNSIVMEGWSSCGKKVAVKVMEKQGLSSARKEELKNEVNVLKQVSGQHKNICSLLSVSEDFQTIQLAFEYYPLSLFDLCNELGALYEEEAKPLFAQLVSAIAFLHNYQTEHFDGICHRDLKLENIMLSEDRNKLSLIDFGFATFIRPGEKLTKKCGSFHYVAPEVIKGEEYDGKKVDCWALGCILYAMLMNLQPFDAEETSTLFKKIISGQYEDLPSHFSEEVRSLIKGLLQADPRKRMDINQLKAHPWFLKSKG